MKSLIIFQYASRVISAYLTALKINQQKLTRLRHTTALHETRVACRRLRTSLWIFKDIVPKDKYRAWKTSLKQFAKTLGSARDLDVQIAFLQRKSSWDGQSHSESEAIRQLIATLRSQRRLLREKIIQAEKHFVKEKTLEHIQECLTRHKDDPETIRFNELINRKILQRLERLLSFKKFVNDPKKARELHSMRIAAKHLRYTMEIFSQADKRLVPYIAPARRLQRILGQLHDFDVWIKGARSIGSYDSCLRAVHAPALLTRYKSLRERTHQRFVKVWENQQRKKVWETLEKLLDN